MTAISEKLTLPELQSAYCASLDNFRDTHEEVQKVSRIVENLKTNLSYYYTNQSYDTITTLQASAFNFMKKIDLLGKEEKLSPKDSSCLKTLFISHWHMLDLDHVLLGQVSKSKTSKLSFPSMQTKFFEALSDYGYFYLKLAPKELIDPKISLATKKIKYEFSQHYPGSPQTSLEEGTLGFIEIIQEVGIKEKLSEFHIENLKQIFLGHWAKLS